MGCREYVLTNNYTNVIRGRKPRMANWILIALNKGKKANGSNCNKNWKASSI
jgi:hypothetical protein